MERKLDITSITIYLENRTISFKDHKSCLIKKQVELLRLKIEQIKLIINSYLITKKKNMF